MSERLALRLNELAEEPIARAATARSRGKRAARSRRPSRRARCIVATSSLELGIDMGAVDLVVQVSSPGSVASGLQRFGHERSADLRLTLVAAPDEQDLAQRHLAAHGGLQALDVDRVPLGTRYCLPPVLMIAYTAVGLLHPSLGETLEITRPPSRFQPSSAIANR